MSVTEFQGPPWRGAPDDADFARSGDVGRTPPQDLTAEQSVLGAMLLSKDAIADVIESVRGTDFYRPAHETVFDAVLDLYGRGEPADAVTVAAELQRRGELAAQPLVEPPLRDEPEFERDGQAHAADDEPEVWAPQVGSLTEAVQLEEDLRLARAAMDRLRERADEPERAAPAERSEPANAWSRSTWSSASASPDGSPGSTSTASTPSVATLR